MATPVFILICICLLLVLKAHNGYFDYELVMSTSFILENSLKVLGYLNLIVKHNFLKKTNFNKENCFLNI